MNTTEFLEAKKVQIFEQLRQVSPTSVQIQTGQAGTAQTPADEEAGEEEGKEADPDARETEAELDARVDATTEFYDGEKDQDAAQ